VTDREWEDPRRILMRYSLAPKKALSQNFLVSRKAVEAIVTALAPAPGEIVVELGSGVGTLTGALLRAGARVIAVECDRDLVAVLQAEFRETRQLTIVEGDAATFDPATLAGSRIAIVGNLPYAITGAILRNLCARAGDISRAVIMVQREVRDRLVASPATPQYGALTVFVQARFEVATLFGVPASAFHPPPKVESAVVRLCPHAVPRAPETEAFRAVVRAAFQARRKMLRNALLQAMSAAEIDLALGAAGIDGRRRGETLSIEEFATLARALEHAPSSKSTGWIAR
jgi:16S rRNA (adenine1518-N6/adenine1519-N6)-dimethyltransferase